MYVKQKLMATLLLCNLGHIEVDAVLSFDMLWDRAPKYKVSKSSCCSRVLRPLPRAGVRNMVPIGKWVYI